jgi:hypothetical protein
MKFKTLQTFFLFGGGTLHNFGTFKMVNSHIYKYLTDIVIIYIYYVGNLRETQFSIQLIYTLYFKNKEQREYISSDM